MDQAERRLGDALPHVAMPRLTGQPAYGRPPRQTADAPRPIDPDDLPLEAYRTDEDHAAYVAVVGVPHDPRG